MPTPQVPPSPEPASFVGGRYQVKKLLGEGGKKKVYLVHDNTLDRDVAFALIKTEKLDDEARTRIKREAQAMGRLGDHPNIVTLYDFGDHEGQPYIVLPQMPGGDVEGFIEKAPEHRLPLEQAISIAKSVCQGLEFAHSRGIIHRDLKPGNVWMSADGTAKIGDFGLAVAVDLSRLTQEGMMVGTASYMPPEQAMGGEVTAKADLYSLGAMLYEMVTGRPPFIGDDWVYVVSQHINTSVVSPTWHRADLPAGLEVLILQLLEKDPEKRPNSAGDVLKALESIEAGKVEKEPSQVTAAPENSPLYRTVFVGREPEQKQLQAAFDGAMSGQGALMMVVGEPGIGKTALCEQLSTYVTLRGGKTLVGHCYEEGSLSLPYLAFVEAMRSYVLTRETRNLRRELGTGAADVARIVSEVREKLKVELKPSGNPEEERYRLFQAVTAFLTNAAKVQPLLIVLEDLHDSDKGTLEMLTHVSRNLSGARLLIVGTYRDVEVDRTHPLSTALAELRRATTFNRVLLRGLNADEVRRMLESITREEVPWSLAEAVYRQTEGNPLFVQEVIRYIAEEGLLYREKGQWRITREKSLEMSIPEGLRDVVGKRLSGLSQECNNLLSIASVIGREFRLAVLQNVANVSDDELFIALEEAKGTAVVEERSTVGAAVTYRFSHAFFRQTLYEEIIAPRRIRLHQQAGQALEEVYARRLEEHAAELAEHFSYSSDPADLAKAINYGEMAARKAISVYAYGEAARLLEQALKVQEVLDPEDKAKQCDLLLLMAEALLPGEEHRQVVDDVAPRAFALAEEMGDNIRASRACLRALDGLHRSGCVNAFSDPAIPVWAERADQFAPAQSVDRVWVDMRLSWVRMGELRFVDSQTLRRHALELARRLDDPDALFFAIYQNYAIFTTVQEEQERLQLTDEALTGSSKGVSSWTQAEIMWHGGDTYLCWGQRSRAEDIWQRAEEVTERTGDTFLLLHKSVYDNILHLIDGRLQEAVAAGDALAVQGQQLGLPVVSALFGAGTTARPRLYLGQADEVLSVADAGGLIGADLWRGLCLAYLGRNTEALDVLTGFTLSQNGGDNQEDTPTTILLGLLEIATIIGQQATASLLSEQLETIADMSILNGMTATTCPARHLGAAAALLDEPDKARAYYHQALEACAKIRYRPELALTRLQLAELLLEHYPQEKSEALEHLDFAISEFREMKMRPSLERALRHKEILGA